MKINYRKLRNNIPSEIKPGKKYTFKVEFVDSVGKHKNGKPYYGETEFSPNTIRIYNKAGDEYMVKTYFHEYLHAFKLYKNMHLTEEQVKAFERKFEFFYEFFSTLMLDDDKEK